MDTEWQMAHYNITPAMVEMKPSQSVVLCIRYKDVSYPKF